MLDPFSAETGIAVEVEVFSDVREIFNKLVVGGTGIHALTDGSYHSRFFLEEDLLQPVDVSNIPNWENIIPAFKEADGITKDGEIYGVPFIFGTDSVAYRGDQIEGPVDSLDILWDPQYAGKIAMPGGLLESIFVAAMRLGFDDPFDLSDEQLEEVKQSLLEQKPLLRTYWVEIGDLKNLFATGEVAVAFSWVPVLELNKEGIDMRWAVPKEGQLGWYDANFITKEASPEEKLAVEQLMNWTLGDQYGATLAEEVAYRTTSQLAIEQMSPELVEELSLGDPESLLARTVWWVPEARSDAYEQVWNEVLNS
jgi:spermidine/putrescine-binding protein